MKKSELFKKIYENLEAIGDPIAEAYKDETISSELADDALDLEIEEKITKYVDQACYWYSAQMYRVFAVSLAETIADFIKVEDDVELSDAKQVDDLIYEVTG